MAVLSYCFPAFGGGTIHNQIGIKYCDYLADTPQNSGYTELKVLGVWRSIILLFTAFLVGVLKGLSYFAII